MVTDIQIHSRKNIKGPESELVDKFLNFIEIFYEKNFQYTILTEAYAEAGIPDILLIEWDKNALRNWPPERNNLTKEDIKVIHFIFSFGGKSIKIETISTQLGYRKREIQCSLNRLELADLVTVTDKKASPKDFQSKFFIRRIITIEAKIRNWKRALHQAELNQNFASHSYVLLPEKSISENVATSFRGNIGLLAQDDNRVIFKKRAKKGKLPGSYFSWILNEYIGRCEFASVNM